MLKRLRPQIRWMRCRHQHEDGGPAPSMMLVFIALSARVTMGSRFSLHTLVRVTIPKGTRASADPTHKSAPRAPRTRSTNPPRSNILNTHLALSQRATIQVKTTSYLLCTVPSMQMKAIICLLAVTIISASATPIPQAGIISPDLYV